MAENVLSIDNIDKSHDGRPLISALSLGVNAGEKVGLIGRNGAGKSTLLNMIAGLDQPEIGNIALRKELRMAFLHQLPSFPGLHKVGEVLQSALGELKDCISAYEQAVQNQAANSDDLLQRIEKLGGWDADHRIDLARKQLKIPDDDTPLEQLSGGERKRLALAKILIEQAQFLLLDEPTNHLDAETVEWLESWLQQSQATVIVVTHDRYFLDKVVDRLIELRNGQLHSYRGNYTDYVSARVVEEALRERSQQRRLHNLLGELEWARRSPQARTGKSKARLQRIDEAQAEVQRLAGPQSLGRFDFATAPKLGKQILEIDDVQLQFDPQRPLVKGLSMMLRRGERIGVIGPNGCGKSTLLKAIAGLVETTAGQLRLGVNTKIAYFDQQRSSLNPDLSVQANLCPDGGNTVFPGGGEGLHVAAWLDRFGFSAATHQRQVSTLSGGERNRLAIARFLLSPANVLLLDEPTNDLDIPTLGLLEEAIARFDGCVLIVSHDRYLLDKVCTGILGFESQWLEPGTVTLVQGDYTFYSKQRATPLRSQYLNARQQQKKDAGKNAESTAPKKTKQKRANKLSYREQKELDGIEDKIAAAETRVVELEAIIASPDFWSQAHEETRSVQSQLEQARADAEGLFDRWESLMTRQQGS